MYMLDTNICIYIIKQQPKSVLKKFESLSVGSVAMSLVTLGELEYGALRSSNSEEAMGVLEELVNYIPVLHMAESVAREYADIRAGFSREGNTNRQ